MVMLSFSNFLLSLFVYFQLHFPLFFIMTKWENIYYIFVYACDLTFSERIKVNMIFQSCKQYLEIILI